jgi:carbohydrate-binding DOMON domain-containing protein
MNSRYTLPQAAAYDRIIYVGGGVRLEDAAGSVMAQYDPLEGDERAPLGDVASKTVEFSLPLDLIGRPSKSWKYTVLVGAQDDHGGGGIGEFRSVVPKKPPESNVYDTILPKK